METILNNYENWAVENNELLSKLVQGQSPEVLWIACSDSRVAPNLQTKSEPGQLFVHRNIANMLQMDDNSQAVLEYAVEHLHVRHICIVGHQKCGGCMAALEGNTQGSIHRWLAPLRKVVDNHRDELSSLTKEEKWDKVVELNVIAQVNTIAQMHVVQEAWRHGQAIAIHGLVQSLVPGKMVDLGVTKEGL
ncbi:Carbonic anhydrase [Carpediemonas membranifera]|uniref:Carbonic anhydrase n=1 Tax=Carpediemonas membranifera TaxID=201153 RepID=A0A8J6E022_9EUKA|nr:Carbonic anhydrase [Carpediemonas membranifera]|eukprot:KAG9391211.1 Carbonic anhydrase [Carpediemonas membranifera]